MDTQYTALNYEDMKCMWLSQFDLSSIYCENGKQRDAESFRALMATVLDNVKANGMNTVILQLRPNADSMYPSEIYPPSAYVVGAYGNNFSYDAVEIVLELAKERELSIHAWINPLRAMTDTQIRRVPRSYTIRKWLDDEDLCGKYMVQVGDNWYLNPAYAEVRELILDGAREIMQKYDFDGLHMDDYFYPTTEASFDAAAYKEYKQNGGKKSVESFRKENLNLLVSGLWQMTKSVNPEMIFGISPAGNNQLNYNELYADVGTWVKGGYVDYIIPQLYFGYDFSIERLQYDNLVYEWSKYKNDVTIYAGLGAYKIGNATGSEKDEWSSGCIMEKMINYSRGYKYSGFVIFSYTSLFSDDELNTEERNRIFNLIGDN